MALNQKKFLDYNGLVQILRTMQNYPTNDILGTVIDAIDSVKADKEDTVTDVSFTDNKITQTKNGVTSDVVTIQTLQAALASSTASDFIHQDTTAHWDAQRTSLIGEENHLYIYTDYDEVNNVTLAGIKIGDGQAYLCDIPFINGNNTKLNAHIADTVAHITSAERAAWNDKVTCFLSQGNSEILVFTKGVNN